jgi:hypothetical protein
VHLQRINREKDLDSGFVIGGGRTRGGSINGGRG